MSEILRISQPDEYLRLFTSAGSRPDGRHKSELRSVLITRGNLGNAFGSALVRLGSTSVICGVTANIAAPKTESPKNGYVVANVELGPLCSSAIRPGPPNSESQQLTQLMSDLLLRTGLIKTEDLCLKEGKYAWCLHVDLVCLNYDGNVVDACSAAMLAALFDTQLPAIDFDEGCSEPIVHYENKIRLQLHSMPLTATYAIFDDTLLADPSADEARVQDGEITIVVDDTDNCSILKPGGVLLPEPLDTIIKSALESTKLVRRAILHPDAEPYR